MCISYDVFTGAFLAKIMEYDFAEMDDFSRTHIIDGYMKKAISAFGKICKYDLRKTGDDESRVFNVDIPDEYIDEIADIISEGMLMHWLKPYVYHQDNLSNLLNTRDYSTYSPGEFLNKISGVHASVQRNFTNMQRDYSYRHGDLTDLHL